MNIEGQINQKGLSMGQPPPRKHVLGILVYVDPQTLNFPNASKIYAAVCDGTQNVKRYRYFFPVLNIFDTDTGTFFSTKNFPITVPRLFSGTKFFQYRIRDFFQVPMFSDTQMLYMALYLLSCINNCIDTAQ